MRDFGLCFQGRLKLWLDSLEDSFAERFPLPRVVEVLLYRRESAALGGVFKVGRLRIDTDMNHFTQVMGEDEGVCIESALQFLLEFQEAFFKDVLVEASSLVSNIVRQGRWHHLQNRLFNNRSQQLGDWEIASVHKFLLELCSVELLLLSLDDAFREKLQFPEVLKQHLGEFDTP